MHITKEQGQAILSELEKVAAGWFCDNKDKIQAWLKARRKVIEAETGHPIKKDVQVLANNIEQDAFNTLCEIAGCPAVAPAPEVPASTQADSSPAAPEAPKA